MAERFGWIGKSRSEAVRENLAATCKRWILEWVVGNGIGMGHVDLMPQRFVTTGGALFEVSHGNARALLALDGMRLEDLAVQLTAMDKDAGADPFAAGLAHAALSNLGAQILRAESGGALEAEILETWPAQKSYASSLGAVWFRVDLGGIGMVVAVNRTAVDRMRPAHAADFKPLIKREKGVDGSRVALDMVLPMGTATVSDMSDLAVGDVLISERTLDEPIDIRVAGTGSPIAKAELARRGKRLHVAVKAQT